MKRILTSLVTLLTVFVVFALIISPLRSTPVALTVLFFPTVHTSAEALAYISFFIGLSLSTIIAIAGDLALRRRFRTMLLEQRRQLEVARQASTTAVEAMDPTNEGTRLR